LANGNQRWGGQRSARGAPVRLAAAPLSDASRREITHR